MSIVLGISLCISLLVTLALVTLVMLEGGADERAPFE